MNQSELEVITCSWRKARENACEWITIGLGFTSDWMKKEARVFLSQLCSVVMQNQLLIDAQMKTALSSFNYLRLHVTFWFVLLWLLLWSYSFFFDQVLACNSVVGICVPACQNGGTCVNTQCQCSQGLYEGNYCQTRKFTSLALLLQLPMLLAYGCPSVYKCRFATNSLDVSSMIARTFNSYSFQHMLMYVPV